REPGPRNHLKFMTARLGLTPEQQTQAAAIFADAEAGESSAHTGLKTARQALQDAIKSNNTVGIEQLSASIGNLTAQLTAAQYKPRAAFYQVLTPDQPSKLDQMETQRFTRFGHGARSTPHNPSQ